MGFPYRSMRSNVIAPRGGARRRAMGYAAVLAISMLIAVIGLGTLLTSRVELRGVELIADSAAADELARSGLEMVAHRLNNDETWRSTYVNDTWVSDQAFRNGLIAFKLVDEGDGNLADDPYDLVRAYTRVSMGSVMRIYSAVLVPDANSPLHLLANRDIEAGLTSWTGLGENTLSTSNSSPHGGALCLRAAGALLADTGPYQDVTARIKNNTTYYSEVWVRGSLLSSIKKASLIVNTTTGTYTSQFTASWTTTGWTKMSGLLTTAWSGTLISAYWHVEGNLLILLTGEIFIDDALLIEGSTPTGRIPLYYRPGTVRREVMP